MKKPPLRPSGYQAEVILLYRGMDRAALDAAYNNTRAVSDFQAIFTGFQSRSARLYETSDCQRDLRYGD
ncbi:MAG TPA: hypothetical protein VN813_02540, partial [Luteibacter sp.]|nr:hypothetical protein [Luteibacter sp.]